MMNTKGNEMGFEKKVLAVVESITDTHAYFYNGTLFLETQDSKIATDVFSALCDQITGAISFGRCGNLTTSYDFLA
jgi:hypothetical protein